MGWTLCHYATAPAGRPGCQVTAVVRRGTTALCASCDALRSTLGKGQPPTPIPAPSPASVLDWIGQAHTRLAHAEAELTAAVTRARQHGHSWAAIAARLHITRQAAQQRFGTGQPSQHPPDDAESPQSHLTQKGFDMAQAPDVSSDCWRGSYPDDLRCGIIHAVVNAGPPRGPHRRPGPA